MNIRDISKTIFATYFMSETMSQIEKWTVQDRCFQDRPVKSSLWQSCLKVTSYLKLTRVLLKNVKILYSFEMYLLKSFWVSDHAFYSDSIWVKIICKELFTV